MVTPTSDSCKVQLRICRNDGKTKLKTGLVFVLRVTRNEKSGNENKSDSFVFVFVLRKERPKLQKQLLISNL
jgi:hypothetical protein